MSDLVRFKMGVRRYGTLERFLKENHGRIDVDGVRDVLKDVAKPWFLNVQSMIFLPARRSMYLAVGDSLPMARQPFVKLSRDVLFGAK